VKDKVALRRSFKALLARIPPKDRTEAADKLAGRVCGYEPFRSVCSVALFASFRDEIPTDSLVKALVERGVRVVLPRVEAKTHRMSMCDFSDLENLELDRFGIRTPDGAPFTGRLDVIFVPGLAFGLDGSRLGYGGGFYDRYLSAARTRAAMTCGLGYDVQVVESLPMEVHDVRLNYIVTPDRALRCTVG